MSRDQGDCETSLGRKQPKYGCSIQCGDMAQDTVPIHTQGRSLRDRHRAGIKTLTIRVFQEETSLETTCPLHIPDDVQCIKGPQRQSWELDWLIVMKYDS